MNEPMTAMKSEYATSPAAPTLAPLRETEVDLNQALERVEQLTGQLIARINSVLLPDVNVEARGPLGQDVARSELGNTLAGWRIRLLQTGDHLSNAIDRVDL